MLTDIKMKPNNLINGSHNFFKRPNNIFYRTEIICLSAQIILPRFPYTSVPHAIACSMHTLDQAYTTYGPRKTFIWPARPKISSIQLVCLKEHPLN